MHQPHLDRPLHPCTSTLTRPWSREQHVHVLSDGLEAVRDIQKRHHEGGNKYACVFMDVNMPVMCGDDATALLREWEAGDEKRGSTLVIGLSAYANEETRRRCLRKGMDMYETKPMMRRTLMRLLREVARAYGAAPSTPAMQLLPHFAPLAAAPPDRDDDDTGNERCRGPPPLFVRIRRQWDGPEAAKHHASRAGPPASRPPDEWLALVARADKRYIDLDAAWQHGARSVPCQRRLLEGLQCESADALVDAASRSDWARLSRVAHRISGSFSYVYAHDAVRTLDALEAAATAESPSKEAVAPLLRAACEALERVQASIVCVLSE